MASSVNRDSPPVKFSAKTVNMAIRIIGSAEMSSTAADIIGWKTTKQSTRSRPIPRSTSRRAAHASTTSATRASNRKDHG